VKIIVVDPRTWIRGNGSGFSFLLRCKDAHLCCMGFAAYQYGHTARHIGGISTWGPLSRRVLMQPERNQQAWNEAADWHDVNRANGVQDLYSINDYGVPFKELTNAVKRNIPVVPDNIRIWKLNQVLSHLAAPFRFHLKEDA